MTLEEIKERLKEVNRELKIFRARRKRMLYQDIYPLMDEQRELREKKKQLKETAGG